jgi:hypothetical protein
VSKFSVSVSHAPSSEFDQPPTKILEKPKLRGRRSMSFNEDKQVEEFLRVNRRKSSLTHNEDGSDSGKEEPGGQILPTIFVAEP